MAEFRPIIINLLLLSLFVIAIIIGGTYIAVQNNGTQSIVDDATYSDLKDDLTANLEDNYDEIKESSASFENSSVTLTSGIPFVDSIYGTWKIIKNVPMTTYNLIVGVLFVKLFGNPATAIITAVLGAILIITIIFAVVKLVSTGEGG